VGCKLLEPVAKASVLDTVDRVLIGVNQVLMIATESGRKALNR
jgi:hypothetical protein